jgi:hypothetical protein
VKSTVAGKHEITTISRWHGGTGNIKDELSRWHSRTNSRDGEEPRKHALQFYDCIVLDVGYDADAGVGNGVVAVAMPPWYARRRKRSLARSYCSSQRGRWKLISGITGRWPLCTHEDVQ